MFVRELSAPRTPGLRCDLADEAAPLNNVRLRVVKRSSIPVASLGTVSWSMSDGRNDTGSWTQYASHAGPIPAIQARAQAPDSPTFSSRSSKWFLRVWGSASGDAVDRHAYRIAGVGPLTNGVTDAVYLFNQAVSDPQSGYLPEANALSWVEMIPTFKNYWNTSGMLVRNLSIYRPLIGFMLDAGATMRLEWIRVICINTGGSAGIRGSTGFVLDGAFQAMFRMCLARLKVGIPVIFKCTAVRSAALHSGLMRWWTLSLAKLSLLD
jgi:hypothetical protein